MERHLRSIVGASLLAMVVVASAASAQSPLGSPFGASSIGSGYQPQVPVSAFARPFLDPTRFHISTSVSVGSGFSGKTSALQVTSFSYQFTRPAWLQVSVGNSMGSPSSRGNGMFLEGLSLGFRPSANTVFQIQYRDLRSPLQYGNVNDPFALNRW